MLEINFQQALKLYNELIVWENKIIDWNPEDDYLKERKIQIRQGLKFLRNELYYLASHLEDKKIYDPTETESSLDIPQSS